LSLQVEHNNNGDKEKEKDRIDWRRSKVQELSSKGNSQREIAQILQVSNGTVNRDLSVLRQQAKANIKRYIDERLPEEYEKCLVGITSILREAWNTDRLNDKVKSSSSRNSNKNSKESDEPDEDEDQLEEEQEEEQTGEMTVNHVF
jgi:predicted transcriptional regulator